MLKEGRVGGIKDHFSPTPGREGYCIWMRVKGRPFTVILINAMKCFV